MSDRTASRADDLAQMLETSQFHAHIGLTSHGSADTYRALYGRR
jgi:hypothetical protein